MFRTLSPYTPNVESSRAVSGFRAITKPLPPTDSDPFCFKYLSNKLLEDEAGRVIVRYVGHRWRFSVCSRAGHRRDVTGQLALCVKCKHICTQTPHYCKMYVKVTIYRRLHNERKKRFQVLATADLQHDVCEARWSEHCEREGQAAFQLMQDKYSFQAT